MQYQKAESRSLPVIVFSALKSRLFNFLITYNSNSPTDEPVITSLPFSSFRPSQKSQTFSVNQQFTSPAGGSSINHQQSSINNLTI